MQDVRAALQDLPRHLGERAWASGTGTPPRYVLYWMRSALRAHENPALDVALALGAAAGVPVFVYQGLDERWAYASDRHHRFILEGARDVARALRDRGIGAAFHLAREGHRSPALRDLATEAGWVVTEDLPVPMVQGWDQAVERVAQLVRVDTACVVPMRLTPRPERAFRWREATAAARATRVATPWPQTGSPAGPFVPTLPFEPFDLESELASAIATCAIDHGIAPVRDTEGGTVAGQARWSAFLERRLERYGADRNDPTRAGVSRMSAYLHYGMVSPFRLARDAHERGGPGAEKYLDELLVWRELAYALCAHEPSPGSLSALPSWARETLDAHRDDPRPAWFSWEALARGRTGEPLWDLAQRSLVRHGELHNNVRMTWGKALLEWSRTPEEALGRAIDLNHRYALDGRDPASYAGLLWCLGALDRPFDPAAPIRGRLRPRPVAEHERRVGMLAYRAHVERPTQQLGRVAVIGAGIAGLACARTLADHGVDVRVFDKGRRVGGRLNVRRDSEHSFDHGAQYLTVRSPAFTRYARSWRDDDVIANWSFLERDGRGGECTEQRRDRPVGGASNRRLPEHLAEDLDISLGVQVAPLAPGGAPHALHAEDGAPLGQFDAVVVTAPLAQAGLLLDAYPDIRERLAGGAHAPCWAVMVAFEERLDAPDALRADGPLAWAARDSSKPGRPAGERWVLHASTAWSEAHLEAGQDEVAAQLLEALSEAFGTLPEVTYLRAHRWRYARVSQPVGVPCVFAPERGLAVAGDGLLGPRVEAAWSSGVAAAGRLLGG